MPENFFEQVHLFRSVNHMLAPHGANNVNTLWMRPNTTYLEIRPTCLGSCLKRCDHHFSHAHLGDLSKNATFYDAIVSSSNAARCGVAMNPFGPMMHQFSGVHFDIVSMCSHGDKCVNATGMFEFSKAEKLRYRSWKYNWDMDVEIDIDSILDFVRAGDAANIITVGLSY